MNVNPVPVEQEYVIPLSLNGEILGAEIISGKINRNG